MINFREAFLFRQLWKHFPKTSRFFATNVSTAKVKDANLVQGAAKDIIIYKFESPRFFRNLNIFAIAQYGFWVFISYSSLQMIDVPVPEQKSTEENEEELPFWRKINLGSDKYKYGLGIGSAFMG